MIWINILLALLSMPALVLGCVKAEEKKTLGWLCRFSCGNGVGI